MKLKHLTVLAIAVLAGCISCVNTNSGLGENFMADNQQFDLFTATMDLDEIYMRKVDSLSGYSSSHATIGAIRNETYGLSTKGCVLTLVPIYTDLDYGTNPEFSAFHLAMSMDTTSVSNSSQQYIIQNVNVYELEEPLTTDTYFANTVIEHLPDRITMGHPIYPGFDSLTFDFSREFGEKYMHIEATDLDSISHYLKKFPGIYITVDEPLGYGGRINSFNLAPLTVQGTSVQLTGNMATLKFRSTYNGEQKDTMFYFYLSPSSLYDVDSLATLGSDGINQITQYAFNTSYHQTGSMQGKATDKIYIEGGTGLKPMIPASELKKLAIEEISRHGDPSKAVITRATIELPFDFPDNYLDMDYFPDYLNPTICLKYNDNFTFASLSDSNISDENQGEINRSTCKYSPDITLHMQQLMKTGDEADLSNYDIWFLIMVNREVSTSTSSSSSSINDYYSQMAYYNYYNSIYNGYGGGYGGYGYGGYGYGGYGMSNYYYLQMMMMANSSNQTSSTTVTAMLDKDNFYYAVLNGPEASGPTPKFKIAYAIPKE